MNVKRVTKGGTPNPAHEAAFVAAFVIPDKRSRYSDFLSNPKRRSEILNRLNHFFDFIPERAMAIPRGSSVELDRTLRARGAGSHAYVIGSDRDACELPLEEAIDSALAGWGTIVSCIPGRLALYLQEFPSGDAYILHSQ
jgi:hypothetical protein